MSNIPISLRPYLLFLAGDDPVSAETGQQQQPFPVSSTFIAWSELVHDLTVQIQFDKICRPLRDNRSLQQQSTPPPPVNHNLSFTCKQESPSWLNHHHHHCCNPPGQAMQASLKDTMAPSSSRAPLLLPRSTPPAYERCWGGRDASGYLHPTLAATSQGCCCFVFSPVCTSRRIGPTSVL